MYSTSFLYLQFFIKHGLLQVHLVIQIFTLWGTLVGGGIRRGALRTLKIPLRIFRFTTPNLDAIGTYIS